MCGITGFLDHTNTIDEADLKKATASLAHRGGNGRGILYDKKDHYTLGLANERLPLIDLNANASQPLTSICGNYTITFNGTIFNYLELRENLIKYGVIFSTLSDTEVILECYKKWGNKAFVMFDGSYALALLDRKLNLLLIARDDIGAKPLYFFKTEGFYAFSSEIRGLLDYPNVKKEINKNALATYFRHGYFIGEETIFSNIFKFKTGNLTTIDLHSGNSYESPIIKFKSRPEVKSTESEQQIADKVEELLTESILKRNVANVPIGVLLTGGYDSATVAAILQKNQTKRIRTYTVGYKNNKLDEGPRAKKIAEHLKTNHQEFYLDENKIVDLVKLLPNVFDEPMGDSSVIPLTFLANSVKREVKVMLASEGGDELFGGYRTYAKAIKIDSLMSTPIPDLVKKTILAIIKKTNSKLKEVIEADNVLMRYLAINACFTLPQLDKLLTDEHIIEDNANFTVNTIKGLLIYDLHNYLPNNILIKNDKCFNYFGIDNRDALLKTELIDYLSTLDPQLFINDGQQKYLLKKITHKYIPESLMHSPKKGFVIPLASWLKTTLKPLADFYLADDKLNQHLILNLKEVNKIKIAFKINASEYNAQKIWLILQFQMWYEKWMAT